MPVVVRVGLIGAGLIGAYHARRIATGISGADVTAVFDVANDHAAEVAADVGAITLGRPVDVIEDSSVDAVVIASPGEAHPEQLLACLNAGKPALCEKPLATTTEDCLKVINAEVAHGERLVQIGFMRRFDPDYLRVKAALDRGDIGEPLILHCVHRNLAVPDTFPRAMALTDSVVHEIDTSRWLLEDEIVSVSLRAGRKSPLAANQDPQVVMFETAEGVLVDVESFVNCQYGYDVRCELVGSVGVASLDNPTSTTITHAGRRTKHVPTDWRERFETAFQNELQNWVDSLAAGNPHGSGASAWDGYAATAVAEAGLAALATGKPSAVQMADRPSLYD